MPYPSKVGGVEEAGRQEFHVPALDGVRGLAILLVLSLHLTTANFSTSSHVANFFSLLARCGWMGVDLFFVLSGFLITRILFTTRTDAHYFRNFYIRRALRIFPAYYLVLVALALLTIPLHFNWRGTMPWYFVYLANTLPAGPLPYVDVPTPYWRIDHFWSLQVEEQFYLVWPLLVFLLATKRRIVFCAIALSAVALGLRLYFTSHAQVFTNPNWAYGFTPCRMDSLLAGAALAILWFSRAQPWLSRLAWPVLILTGGTLCVAGWLHHGLAPSHDPFVVTYGFSLLAIAFAAFIAIVMKGGPVEQALRFAPLRSMGKYSYGIYIFHLPLVTLFLQPLRAWLFGRTHSHLVAVILSALLTAALSFAIAWASYQAYEKRFLRLKRRFAYARPPVYHQPGI